MKENEKLASLTRKELVEGALELGIPRPELLTRAELVQEITRVGEGGKVRRPAGFFDVARALLASVVEQGLNLPDAAKFIRGGEPAPPPPAPEPIATVTLAQIYGAQGHLEKALATAEEILRAEPDHEAAQRLATKLRAQLQEQKGGGKALRATPGRKRAALGARAAHSTEAAEPTAESTAPASEPDVPASADVDPVAVLAPAERDAAVGVASIVDVAVVNAAVSGLAVANVAGSVADSGLAEAPVSGTEPGVQAASADFVAVAWNVDPSGKRSGCRVFWELGVESRGLALARWGAGSPALKLLTVTPGQTGTTQREWTAPLSESSRTLGLQTLTETTEVRVALGWATSQAFHVLETGCVVELRAASGARIAWQPRTQANEVALRAWLEAHT